MSLKEFKTAAKDATALVTIAQRSKHHGDLIYPSPELANTRYRDEWREFCKACISAGFDPHETDFTNWRKNKELKHA